MNVMYIITYGIMRSVIFLFDLLSSISD